MSGHKFTPAEQNRMALGCLLMFLMLMPFACHACFGGKSTDTKDSGSNNKRTGNEYVVILSNIDNAHLRSSPGGDTTLVDLPPSTKLRVLDRKMNYSGTLKQEWYKVSYGGYTGWVSQYNTTGEIISEGEY